MKTYLLRVFADSTGKHGDAVSVIIDEGKHIPAAKRQALTNKLGTSETVFINNVARAEISIMHYGGELVFAGVPALGAVWLLAKLNGKPIKTMHTQSGPIAAWQENDLVWVRASLSTMPPWSYKKLGSPKEVERLTLEETKKWPHTMVWAWANEAEGLIRARTFAADWDIPEAQGNGSGSMVLADKLKRNIEIKHGEGSVIFAKPAPNNYADLGGQVAEK